MFFSKQKHETVFFRNYKKFDNSAFREALNRELLKYDLNNIEYDTFQEIIVSLLNVYAPLKKKYLRANHASFVTKELRKAIMLRTRLRNIYLKQRTETTKVAYNRQRNKCVSILKKSKKSYFESLDTKFVKDNEKFWKIISPLFSNKIKSKEKITLVENDEIISSDIEVAKTFQNFFSSIVKNLNTQRDETHLSKTTQENPVLACIEKFSKHPSIVSIKKRMETTSNKFSFKYEDRNKFLTEIENLNSRKASQQNDIPVKILKVNSDICSYILHHNFNNSLFSNEFPKYLKKADITPVFKKDEQFLKTNYRPVSILPTVSKIYERCLCDQINEYFQPLFSKLQCGFRKGQSAQHSLLVLIEKCRKVLDKRGFAGLLLTDLSKAFDCIDHELLIAKLHAYGFNIKSLEFIHSYLYDRIQRVKINSSFSHWSKIESGIPQGSIKGPLLFNIYICDLFFDFIEIDIANYADDTTPYALDSKLENIVKLLEENADKFFHWFSNNYLKANPDKCHLLVNTTGNIRISVRNETISNSSNQKLLGIRFNSNFRFDDHVASLSKKASQKLNALTRVAQYMNLARRRSIMKAFICFQFGYCPLVWILHSRKINNRANSLHERALRVVYRDYNATFSELLSKDKSVTIHQRNLQLLATEIFKTKNELNPKIMEEIFAFKNVDYDLRNNTSLKIGNLKTVYYGTESLINLGAKIWNLLPNEYKELKPLSTSKSRISNWVTYECPCRMCKNYVAKIGFI